jgi:hypothetical protein
MHSPNSSAFIAARKQPPQLMFKSTHQLNGIGSSVASHGGYNTTQHPVLTIEDGASIDGHTVDF